MALAPERKLNDDSSKTLRGGMSPRALVLFCGFLLALSGFSTDAMLPAFLPMARDLSAELSMVQATIPVFMVPFAIGQLMFGSASDRFGRKPVITFGLVVFLLGSALATFGHGIEEVLMGRAAQGFGAAAAPVLGRAILRDIYSGPQLARAMAIAMGIFAIGPICAPLVGYWLEAVSHWRAIFSAMGALAAVLLAVNLFVYEETNQYKDPDALQPTKLFAAFGAVLRNGQSSTFLVVACASYCALLNYVANGPRLYDTSFDVDGLDFAVQFAISGLGIIVGQTINHRMLPVVGIMTALRTACLVLFVVSTMITMLSSWDMLGAWGFTALMFAFNTSFLVIVSNALSLIIDPHPKIAGLVSAFFGFATIASGAVFIFATFDLFDGHATRWGIGMMSMTGIALVFVWLKRATPEGFKS